MIIFREIASAIVFIFGVVLFCDLFSSGFSWEALLLSVLCFGVAHTLWPSKKKGQRQDDYGFLDILEFVMEMPFEILKWSFRILGRVFGGKGDGVDVDF